MPTHQQLAEVDDDNYRCPYCKIVLNGVTNIGGDALPKPGQITVCGGCFKPLQFAEKGIRALEDYSKLSAEEQDDVTEVQTLVVRIRKHLRIRRLDDTMYVGAILAMFGAGYAWCEAHTCANITFKAFPTDGTVIMPLTNDNIWLVACSDDAASLLRARRDALPGQMPTLNMALTALDVLFETQGDA